MFQSLKKTIFSVLVSIFFFRPFADNIKVNKNKDTGRGRQEEKILPRTAEAKSKLSFRLLSTVGIMKNNGRNRGKGAKKSAGSAIVGRKAARKEQRRKKKAGKQQFLLKRFGKDGKASKGAEGHKDAQHKVDKKEPSVPKSAPSSSSKEDQRQRSAEKQRRKRLRQENEVEEAHIRSLEKKLRLDKRRKKTGSSELPASFAEDGLDFLLDACDSDKIRQFGKEEDDLFGEDQDSGSDQEVSDQEEEKPEPEEEGGMVEEEAEASDQEEEEGEDEEDPESGEESAEEEEGDDEEEEEEDSDDEKEEEDSGTWEDIYGRTRDAKGNVLPTQPPPSVSATTATPGGKYVPPALRARLAAESGGGAGEEEKRRQERLTRLRRRLKGLLNRLAAANMSPLVREVEDLYSGSAHARAELNGCLFSLVSESLLESPSRTPERMVLEHALLVSLLHANVGVEVGASFLQSTVLKYRQLRESYDPESNSKEQDNALLFVAALFTFKVAEAGLVFDLLDELAEAFLEKDVELIVAVLRATGFGLRRADPARLKELILKIQRRSSEAKGDGGGVSTRVDFMLEVLMAIKNNNVRKIPNHDDEHQQFLLK